MSFRLPGLTQRTAVIGRTGSGKTVMGAWLLSRSAFDKQPFIIIDYKGDELLGAIDRAHQISLSSVPKHSGLYIVRPRPDETEQVEAFLWKVWAREKIGLFFDEMYLLPDPAKGGALRSIFTQGRAKRIPVIGCTQRPRHISRFLFSEADFFSVFHLNTDGDNQAVAEFTPWSWQTLARERLQRHWSRWYDVAEHESYMLQPVPEPDDILDVFEDRLSPKRRHL